MVRPRLRQADPRRFAGLGRRAGPQSVEVDPRHEPAHGATASPTSSGATTPRSTRTISRTAVARLCKAMTPRWRRRGAAPTASTARPDANIVPPREGVGASRSVQPSSLGSSACGGQTSALRAGHEVPETPETQRRATSRLVPHEDRHRLSRRSGFSAPPCNSSPVSAVIRTDRAGSLRSRSGQPSPSIVQPPTKAIQISYEIF